MVLSSLRASGSGNLANLALLGSSGSREGKILSAAAKIFSAPERRLTPTSGLWYPKAQLALEASCVVGIAGAEEGRRTRCWVSVRQGVASDNQRSFLGGSNVAHLAALARSVSIERK